LEIPSGVSPGYSLKRFSIKSISSADFIAAGATIKVSGAVSGGGSTSTYTIQSGDTLGGIAANFGTTTAALQSANGIKDVNKIYGGQTIRIPGGGSTTSYTVQSGDTLSHIAARYNTTVEALQRVNGIGNKDVIYAGQVLKIGSAAKSSKSSKKHHTVKPGDTVGALATRYGTTQSQIVSWNKLRSADYIQVGQKLRVK